MSSFIKKVLVEQGELDRMHQRQIKEYSPELHALARLHTQIAETLDRKDLGHEQKLQIIGSFQSRFDKLQRDTGVLSSAPRSSSSSEPALAQPEKKDGGTQVVNALSDQDTDDEDEAKDSKGKTLTPALKKIREMHVEPQYEHKARNLMLKILDNPDVLKRNDQGELVVNGVVEPNTNFNSLFSSMVGHEHDLEQPGIDKFLGALRQIGIKSRELSGKSLQRMYSNTPYHVRVSERAPRPKKQQPDFYYDTLGDSDQEYADTQLLQSTSSTATQKREVKKSSKQTGFGLKSFDPPGHRPNILFVYDT